MRCRRTCWRKCRDVYRTQNQKISDKHIETIINQMLRKVKVENPGDTKFLPGEVVDKFRFRAGNEAMAKMLKIDEPGDSGIAVGQVVSREEFKEINAKVEEKGGTAAKGKRRRWRRPRRCCWASPRRRCRANRSCRRRASRRRPKVLTEASIAGKEDTLVGLKENVILGHLIPAGTAFKPYLDMTLAHLGEPVEEPEAELPIPAEPAPVPVAAAPKRAEAVAAPQATEAGV